MRSSQPELSKPPFRVPVKYQILIFSLQSKSAYSEYSFDEHHSPRQPVLRSSTSSASARVMRDPERGSVCCKWRAPARGAAWSLSRQSSSAKNFVRSRCRWYIAYVKERSFEHSARMAQWQVVCFGFAECLAGYLSLPPVRPPLAPTFCRIQLSTSLQQAKWL